MSSPGLHWLPHVERRGLGNLVLSINHIALIVADVGRSLTFYTEVLGLQQIQRPDFDRHGAWLTAGNVEIHLIKGIPVAPDKDNKHLIVPHIALDVSNEQGAFQKLQEMQIDIEVNVSVPKGMGKAESEGGNRNNTLSQAFIRDPDGHYIEICNCHLLTDFALGSSTGLIVQTTTDENNNARPQILAGGNEQKKQKHLKTNGLFLSMTKIVQMAKQAKARCFQRNNVGFGIDAVLNNNGRNDGDSKSMNTNPTEYDQNKVDEALLSNFLARKNVYGDICQSFDSDEIRTILQEAQNSAPRAILIMLEKIYNGHKRLLFQPPAYYCIDSEAKREQRPSSNNHKAKERRFCPEPIEVNNRCKRRRL
jgi:catechol 2,3-dioxygenase-like lactoylglutathione lyase family enzyme